MIFKKIKSSPKALKILQITSLSIFSIAAILYLSFLFILPNAININNFLPQINAQIQKQSGFKLSLENPKLKTTWRLGVKFVADKVSIKYTNDEDFINLSNPSVEINLPTLLFKHLNLDKIYVNDVELALIFTKDKKYTIEEYINKIIENNSTDVENSANQLPIELKNINIEVKNTKITLKDENILKTFIL